MDSTPRVMSQMELGRRSQGYFTDGKINGCQQPLPQCKRPVIMSHSV